MQSTAVCENLLYSRLGQDPDLGEMIPEFVSEMPSRVKALAEALGARDWNTLRRLAHQLKGAGGSYGFDELSLLAARLEGAIRDSAPEDGVAECFHRLVDCCQRVRSGCPR